MRTLLSALIVAAAAAIAVPAYAQDDSASGVRTKTVEGFGGVIAERYEDREWGKHHESEPA